MNMEVLHKALLKENHPCEKSSRIKPEQQKANEMGIERKLAFSILKILPIMQAVNITLPIKKLTKSFSNVWR